MEECNRTIPFFLFCFVELMHKPLQAASFGGSNIDPSAWEDKKNPGESRFPAQVRKFHILFLFHLNTLSFSWAYLL